MADKLFGDAEGVRIAAEIERRGETFYRRAAKLAPSEDMRAFLALLADDEQAHRREFERLAAGCAEAPYDVETGAFLSAVAADIVFQKGLTGLVQAGLDDQAGVLREAIQSEKDSILFYDEMIAATRDERVRAVFAEIVRQEKKHLARLKRMLAGQEERMDGE